VTHYGSNDLILIRARHFYLRLPIQSGSEIHLAFCPVGVGALYLGLKKMDPEGDDSSLLRVKTEIAWNSRYIMTWSSSRELQDSFKT
jgi:hypothetical protein